MLKMQNPKFKKDTVEVIETQNSKSTIEIENQNVADSVESEGSINDTSQLSNENINKYKTILEFPPEKYRFNIQLKEDMEDSENKNEIIVVSVEQYNSIERFIFEKVMKYEDFKELGNLFRLYLSIEEIFNFLIESIDENLITIKEVDPENAVSISIKRKFPGFKTPFTAEIKLTKNERNKDDLINVLYESLEEKNKILEEKNKELEEINNNINEKNEALEEEKRELEELKKELIEEKRELDEISQALEKANKIMNKKNES